jgi:uncharacterized protein (UPF0333 family)
MDEKGQTSMEMLILLGGVVIVALITGLYLKGLLRDQIAPEVQAGVEEAAQ